MLFCPPSPTKKLVRKPLQTPGVKFCFRQSWESEVTVEVAALTLSNAFWRADLRLDFAITDIPVSLYIIAILWMEQDNVDNADNVDHVDRLYQQMFVGSFNLEWTVLISLFISEPNEQQPIRARVSVFDVDYPSPDRCRQILANNRALSTTMRKPRKRQTEKMVWNTLFAEFIVTFRAWIARQSGTRIAAFNRNCITSSFSLGWECHFHTRQSVV